MIDGSFTRFYLLSINDCLGKQNRKKSLRNPATRGKVWFLSEFFYLLVCVVGWEQWWKPWPDHVGGFSLFVLYSVLRVFSLGTLVFPFHQKLTFKELSWWDKPRNSNWLVIVMIIVIIIIVLNMLWFCHLAEYSVQCFPLFYYKVSLIEHHRRLVWHLACTNMCQVTWMSSRGSETF